MASTPSPALSGSLPFAVTLTAVAGFADAHIFLNVVEVFVANQSGNLVLLGMGAGEGRWSAALRHAVAIVAFALGVAVVSRIHERRRRSGRRLRPDLVLGAEALLLLLVAGWIAAGDDAGAAVLVYPVLVMGAFAMGLQTASLLRVGAVNVATTYATGSVARLGSEGALAIDPGDSPDARTHRRALVVLVSIVTAYAGGAALAAWAGDADAWLLLPVMVLVGAAAVHHRDLAPVEGSPPA